MRVRVARVGDRECASADSDVKWEKQVVATGCEKEGSEGRHTDVANDRKARGGVSKP